MAKEFTGGQVDASLKQTDAALPTADGTSYSEPFDLGAESYKGGNFELEVTIPDLTTTHLPNADTLTVNVVAGTTTTPTAVILGSVLVLTGAGGAGADGDTVRVRVPSDCPRYARFQFVAAGGTGDMSGVDAVCNLVFL